MQTQGFIIVKRQKTKIFFFDFLFTNPDLYVNMRRRQNHFKNTEDLFMAKHRKFAVAFFAVWILTMFVFQMAITGANDEFTLPKTNAAPKIDGILDTDIYTKLHDFYEIDAFNGAYDSGREIKGSAYATWDDKNLYVFLAVEAENHDSGSYPAIDMGTGTVGYIAVLASAPGGGWTDNSRFEIGCGVTDDGEQQWKTCSPEAIKDSSDDYMVYKSQPFESFSLRDEAKKMTYYEFSTSWDFLDRGSNFDFKEGHKITLNYACNVHTTVEYFAGNAWTAEMGGGIWSGSYEDGLVITLGAAPAVETEAETAAPETGTDVTTGGTDVTSPAPQTGDPLTVLFIAAAFAGTAIVTAKSKANKKQ